MKADSLCTYPAEDLEFLDTSAHIYMYVMTMYEYKTIKMVLIVIVQHIAVVLM